MTLTKITPLVFFNRPYVTISHTKGEFNFLLPERLTVDNDREISLMDSPHNLKVIEEKSYESFLYEWTSSNILSYSLSCKLRQDCVDFVFRLKNLSQEKYAEQGEAMACLRKTAVPDFVDTTGERTYIVIKDKLIKAVELHSFSPQGMLHYVGGWESSPTLANTLIATVSVNRDYVLGFAWHKTCRIGANFSTRLNCTHSNVLIQRLEPGQEEVCLGKIYFHKGPLSQLYERYKRDYEGWWCEHK